STAGLSRRAIRAVNATGAATAQNPSIGGDPRRRGGQERRAGAMPPSMSDLPPVHGHCHPRFGRVRDAFAANLRDADEIGAAVAVVVDGETVVDLWAGHADVARTRPWERDTIVNVYSCTKGMTALCAHRLVSAGRLDLDVPVARDWPEVAQAG